MRPADPTDCHAAPLDLLAAAPGVSHLPAAALSGLARTLRREEFPAGGVVVAEGDAGDRLFLIRSGRAEVSATGPNGPVILATLAVGEVFGEIAQFEPGGRRQATVTALTPLTAWSLDSATFARTLAEHPEARAWFQADSEARLTAKFLKLATPFAALDPARTRHLAESLQHRRVAAGEIIIRQGEPGDACYLIRSGTVEVLAREGDADEHRLTTLGPGMLFGEAALLTDAPRNATVRALEPGELLVLQRADLLAAMAGGHEVGGQMFDLMRFRQRPRRVSGILAQTRTTADGENITVLKNPKRGAYFRLSAQGWFVWERLDGQHTLRNLALELFVAFKSFSPQFLAGLLGELAEAGFIEAKSLRRDVPQWADRPSAWQRLGARCRRWLDWQVAVKDTDPLIARWYDAGVRLLFTVPGRVILARSASRDSWCSAGTSPRPCRRRATHGSGGF